MKQLFTFCIALVCQFSLSAQDDDYHPMLNEGLTWQIRYFSGLDPMPSGAGHFFLGGDTTIAEFSYAKIVGHPMVALDESPYPDYAVNSSIVFETGLFIREDIVTRKVFIYDSEDSMDELVYDFSLEVGDTLFSEFSDGEFVIAQVDSIQLSNGEQRKRFHSGLGVPYIESVGGMNGLHELLWYPLSGGFSLLECVRTEEELIWSDGGSGCIGFLSTNDKRKTSIAIMTYPNPAANYLTVTIKPVYDSWSYEIVDLFGKSQLQGSTNGAEVVIDVTTLSAGIFIVRLTGEKGDSIQQKFVKGN